MSNTAHPTALTGAHRNYSLTGETARQDGPATRDTIVWIALHILFAAGGIYFWGSWIAVPFFLAYGVVYGSACYSCWYECGHGTAFRNRWMNDAVYHIASFQVMRNPINFRLTALAFAGVYEAWHSLGDLFRNATGHLRSEDKSDIPDSEWPKAVFWARVHVAVYAAILLAVLGMFTAGMGWKSAIPVVLVGGPRVFSCFHFMITELLQNGRLPGDVTNYLLNSRTVYPNPVSRCPYSNMNDHIEHHMFPVAPYSALPALHDEVTHDLPPPNTSLWNGYREMMGAVMKQRTDPTYALRETLPPTAKPYKNFLHQHVPDQTES